MADQTTDDREQPGTDLAVAERDPTAPYESTQSMMLAPVQILRPTNFKEAQEMAKMMATTDMVPSDYRGKPANIVVAWQLGAELGLSPMQALQNISNINGRPAVWGDAALALCKAHHSCDEIEESLEGEGDKMVARCIARRKGKKPVEVTFSVADAKTAGLWGKNVWKNYPKRMLQMRARGFALRDQWPDVLKGILTVEELQGDIIDIKAEPVVNLEQTGTQSFRQPATQGGAGPTDETKPDDGGGTAAAAEPTQEDKDVAEALGLIARAKDRKGWGEVGGLISSAIDAAKTAGRPWSDQSATRVREAYGKRGKDFPSEQEPAWPGNKPPAPGDDGSFGF